jgi:hypothetical protein
VYFSRHFAVSAGRELAGRECVELLVFDDQRALDFRESYRVDGSRPSDTSTTTTELLRVTLHYDSWCLRLARGESERALDGWCTRDLLDEVVIAVTELVLHTTLRTRSDCTLSIHRSDEQILVVVADECGVPPTPHGRCVWARFSLRH